MIKAKSQFKSSGSHCQPEQLASMADSVGDVRRCHVEMCPLRFEAQRCKQRRDPHSGALGRGLAILQNVHWHCEIYPRSGGQRCNPLSVGSARDGVHLSVEDCGRCGRTFLLVVSVQSNSTMEKETMMFTRCIYIILYYLCIEVHGLVRTLPCNAFHIISP